MNKKMHAWLDNMGFSLSMLCAIHCLFFPILLVILPLMGMGLLLNATAEKAFVIGSVAMAALSLCWGFKIHKQWKALLLYLVGAIMLLSATFLMQHSHKHSDEHHEEHTASVEDHSKAHHEEHANEHHEEHAVSAKDHSDHRPQNNPYSLALLILGGVGIASSHLLNKKLCKSCHAHQH